MGRNRQSGFGMMEAIMASAVGVMAVFFLMSGVTNMKKASRHVDSDLDFTGLRKELLDTVDCAATFTGRTKGDPCPTGTYLALKQRNGNNVIEANGTRSGRWVVRAYCSSAANGLDVRALGILPAYDGVIAARNFAQGGAPNPLYYRKDELTSAPYDWTHVRTRLFSPGVAGGLCRGWFGGAPPVSTCAPGQYVKNVDFDSKQVVCANLPNCPVGQMLRGYNPDGSPNCKESGNRVVGMGECLTCEDGTVCGGRSTSGAAYCSGGSPQCSAGNLVATGYYHDELGPGEPCQAVCGSIGTHVNAFQCQLSD